MDELIEDFLVETKEGLEELDNDLVELEKNPEDTEIIGKIFRVMHTIKGTCGFLGLSRLEHVAHAGEDVFDMIRDGKLSVTPEIMSLVFESLDAIKAIVEHIEENETEPEGDDSDLTSRLRACASGESAPEAASAEEAKPEVKEEAKKEEVTPSKIGDSDDLQALFDSTESLIDIEAPQKKEAPAPSKIGDSDDLQALFDSTESLIDIGAPQKKEAPKPSKIGDSDDLQALFDSTESLIDIEAPKTDAKPEAKAPEVAKKEPAPTEKTEEKLAAEEKKPKEEVKKPADAKAKKRAPAQTIRVSLEVLEELMQQASELVLTRNQLMQLLRAQKESDFSTALQRLNSITTELQEGVMKTRMQPVGNAWTKLPRIVRDLSMELGKKIDLKMIGEETELDRQLLELITDPLTHMVRNSADHGLEGPEDRIKAGKPEMGSIELKAYHGGGYIIMEISDDGRGIDPEIIKKKAIEVGLTTEQEAALLSENQILQFIFAPGFSTAEKVTSVSGRGVGMDVVKNNIEKISGIVDLKSTLGKGSIFTIKIPLTLAIMSILQISANGQKFAIPQINVMEIVKVNDRSSFKIETISEKPVLRLRDKLLPLVSLQEILKVGKEDYSEDKSHYIVVCEIGSYHFGVIVEKVFETEEIVVKPVSQRLKKIEVYSGCTILGDGSVILILDPNGLAKSAGDIIVGNESSSAGTGYEDEDITQASFLVFKSGDETPKVAPLELVSRLEEIDVTKIELSRGEPVLQYRGGLMRIVNIDPDYEIPKTGIQEVLVLSNGNKIMGLVVEEILDIAKCPMADNLDGGKEGFLGSMVIDGKTCDVIDVSYYFKKAFQDYNEAPEKSFNIKNKKRILLVDDSPFFRKFIPPELNNAGYSVVTSPDAQDAMARLENGEQFEVVVTDINMPGMNGEEFAKLCKSDERFKDMPFIALSSHTEGKEGLTENSDSNFDAYVAKTHHEELVEVLAGILTKENVA